MYDTPNTDETGGIETTNTGRTHTRTDPVGNGGAGR
jgi:hypothetical protein